MHLTLPAFDGYGSADHINSLDAMAGIAQSVAAAGENLPVAGRVEISEALRELQLLAADVYVAVGRLRRVRQVVTVDGKKPANAGAVIFEVASRFGFTAVVDHVALQPAKDVVQHVIEVHSYVGGQAERFAGIALPALHVPLATGGDVSQLHVELSVRRSGGHFFAQLKDGFVMAQLQDVVDTSAAFLFDEGKRIQHFGGWHQRFFADHVATKSQPSGNVRLMQVIGCTDGHIVELSRGVAFELVRVFVEALELGEERTVRRDAVDDADRVVDIVGHGQVVAGVFDGAHVARSNVSCGADKGEFLHV